MHCSSGAILLGQHQAERFGPLVFGGGPKRSGLAVQSPPVDGPAHGQAERASRGPLLPRGQDHASRSDRSAPLNVGKGSTGISTLVGQR